MFLTSAELETLTGAPSRRGQKAWLDSQNINYWVSRKGEIQLCRDVVIALQMRLNGMDELQKRRRGPAPKSAR